MSGANPTLQGLLADFGASLLAGVHTALPGVVVAYTPATGKASIQPAVPGVYIDPDLGRLPSPLPILPSVPILWPGCGAGGITFPLVAGDSVLVVVAERSTDGWRNDGSVGAPPQDARRFDLSDAFAIPFCRVPSATGYGVGAVLEASTIQLGNNTAVLAVLLASLNSALGLALTEMQAAIGAPAGPNLTALLNGLAAGTYNSTTTKAL
jgi:hypothetical protein